MSGTAVALGLVNTAANALGNIYSNQQNGEYTRDARNWQARMVSQANAYNSPLNQVLRLKAAGLNPDLMYGDASANALSAAPPGTTQPTSVNPMYGSPDLAANYLSAKNLEAQNRLINAQAESQEQQNSTYFEGLLKQWRNLDASTASINASIDKTFAEIGKINADKSLTEQQKETEIYRTLMAQIDAYVANATAEDKITISGQQVQMNNEQIQNLQATRKLIVAQIYSEKCKASNLVKEGKILDQKLKTEQWNTGIAQRNYEKLGIEIRDGRLSFNEHRLKANQAKGWYFDEHGEIQKGTDFLSGLNRTVYTLVEISNVLLEPIKGIIGGSIIE